MFGLGFGEILVILLVALIVFGPERLPTIARQLGRGAGQSRRAMDEFKREINISEFDPLLRGEPKRHSVVQIPNPPEEKLSTANCETPAIEPASEKEEKNPVESK